MRFLSSSVEFGTAYAKGARRWAIPTLLIKQQRQRGEDGGGEPEDFDGGGFGKAQANQAVREVVGVAVVKGFSQAPADEDDLDHVEERDGEDQQRNEDGPMAGMADAIEMREDGEDGQEVADEMAAGVAKESTGARKIAGKKTEQ